MSDQTNACELVPLNRYADLPKEVDLHQGTEAGYLKKYGCAPRKAYTIAGRIYFEAPKEAYGQVLDLPSAAD